MTRVLSTEIARESVVKLNGIINGGLVEQITALSTTARTLSQPDVWDGTAAIQFRGVWDQTERALRDAQTQLEALRVEVDRINNNIMAAGGNL